MRWLRCRSSGLVAGVLVMASVNVVASGCGTGMPGDCVARVRVDGVVYVPLNDVDARRVPAGEPLGSGEVVDCGSVDTAPAVDSVKLVSIEGVDASVALLVQRGWRGLYVADGLERSSWPSALRDAVRQSRRPQTS